MLELKNVSKTFNPGTINAKTALSGLNLRLNDGDFVTVIGGNGAGKSTMLNAIAGVFEIDGGSISIDGVDITRQSEHKRAAMIGRVFQDPMLGTAPTMTIEENLGLGLEDRMTSRAGLLSGGQRQALTLLMASLVKPRLLLLDEHTAALDPGTAARVLELSDQIVSEGRLTTLMVTHNMRDAIEHGNRLIMMNEGRIVLDISGEEKKRLTVDSLLARFSRAAGEDMLTDRVLIGA